MADTDKIEAVRAHVERHKDRERAMFTVAGVSAILSELSRLSEAEKRLRGALDRLVNAKALHGVREMVAGWNGESREDGPYDRHPSRLGATLPKTNCGAVYELDEALVAGRSALSEGDGK
jgi:hypothetical protein